MSKAKTSKKEANELTGPDVDQVKTEINSERIKQIQKLLELTSSKEAINLQRYPSLTNNVIERYKELHAEIEKLLEF